MSAQKDSPLPERRDEATLWTTASSIILRLVGYTTLTYPHVFAWPLGAIVVPLSYLSYLWLWLGCDQRHHSRKVVEVKEVIKVVESGGSKIRRLNGMEKEIHVRREGEVSAVQPVSWPSPSAGLIRQIELHRDEQLDPPGLASVLFGTPCSSRWINIMSLFINTVITLGSLDSLWTTSLLFSSDDLQFARYALSLGTAQVFRTTSLTPHSSSLSFRIPSQDLHPYTARIAFRPLLDPTLLSVASPLSWQQSERITLSDQEDWKGVVKLEGLAGGTQYECESANLVIPD